MGWARSAWMAVALLAFAAGNATDAEPKRVLLLHSFDPNFPTEDTFAGYLRTDLAEKSPYPLDPYEVLLEIARFSEVSGMRRLWSTSKRFSRGTRPMSARTIEFHKYQMMEVNGLRTSAELIHFAIKHGIVTI
jgi:hypothetical protein